MLQIVPPEHPNPTTKIGSKMGGEFIYQPKWDPKTVLTTTFKCNHSTPPNPQRHLTPTSARTLPAARSSPVMGDWKHHLSDLPACNTLTQAIVWFLEAEFSLHNATANWHQTGQETGVLVVNASPTFNRRLVQGTKGSIHPSVSQSSRARSSFLGAAVRPAKQDHPWRPSLTKSTTALWVITSICSSPLENIIFPVVIDSLQKPEKITHILKQLDDW